MKRHTVREDRGHILFAFVSTFVVGKNPNTPNWSSMADNAITWGSIEGLGSCFYICGMIFVCVCFRVCVVGENQNTPNWSSMADNAITWGGIGVLGSLFYICGMISRRQHAFHWTLSQASCVKLVTKGVWAHVQKG